MASPTANKVRLGLAVAAVALMEGGGGWYFLTQQGAGGATYVSPRAATTAPGWTTGSGTASAPLDATASGSQTGQGTAQAAAQAAPQDRWFMLTSRWNPVRSGVGFPAAQAGYAISFGPLAQPVRVPPSATPAPITAAEANPVIASFTGGGFYQGAACLTDDNAVCVVLGQMKGGQPRDKVYVTVGRAGNAWLPVANTPYAEKGPLIVDYTSGAALFTDFRSSSRDLLDRADLAEWLLMLAETHPHLQQAIMRQSSKEVGFKPFQWASGPGWQMASLEFAVGDRRSGARAAADITVQPLSTGFVRATIANFRPLQ